MTDDERIMAHFNENSKPCRQSREKPRLQWDGCWFIVCGEACRCSISDGDNLSPTPILTRWHERQV